mmetsp:Transcript_72604/g.234704  ORF Transcript_72604/g.234704 Transcript_72604/m.234704 type:complete len:244 (-) Transcript_72604:12-743(-)
MRAMILLLGPMSPYMKDSKPKYLISISYSGLTSSGTRGNGAGHSGLAMRRNRKCESNLLNRGGSTSRKIRPSLSRLCPESKFPENIPARSEPSALQRTARLVDISCPPTLSSTTSSVCAEIDKIRCSISSNNRWFSLKDFSATSTSSICCVDLKRSFSSRALIASASSSYVASSNRTPTASGPAAMAALAVEAASMPVAGEKGDDSMPSGVSMVAPRSGRGGAPQSHQAHVRPAAGAQDEIEP